MADQIEDFAAWGGQLKGVPTRPDDEVGLAAGLGQEAFQYRHAGVIPVANANLARGRFTSVQRLGAMFVSQFKMRKPAASKVEHAMNPPIRSFAAGLADAGTIRQS
jgi:hypothetical protein